MTGQTVEPQPWSTTRWGTLIGLVLATQLGLIFWLGRPQRVSPSVPELAPTLQLTEPRAAQVLALNDPTLFTLLPHAAQILALNDPTLFALPHREGFSGPAWLILPARDFRPFIWSEAPRWLDVVEGQLGSDFKAFMATNALESLPSFERPDLQLKVPEQAVSGSLPDHSTLRLMGALAARRLLMTPTLPSWPSAVMLTNSLVQLMVGADGKPISATLLAKSGSSEADQHALRAARDARFAPLDTNDPTSPQAGISWGQLIFEWHSLPLTATNHPAQTGPLK